MDQKQYKVVYNGRVAAGKEVGEVKQALAALMRADLSQVEILFSGRAIVVKKNLSLESAERYVTAFNSVGALAEARPQDEGTGKTQIFSTSAMANAAITHAAPAAGVAAQPSNDVLVAAPAPAPYPQQHYPAAALDDDGNPLVNGIGFILKVIFSLILTGAVAVIALAILFEVFSIWAFLGTDLNQVIALVRDTIGQ